MKKKIVIGVAVVIIVGLVITNEALRPEKIVCTKKLEVDVHDEVTLTVGKEYVSTYQSRMTISEEVELDKYRRLEDKYYDNTGKVVGNVQEKIKPSKIIKYRTSSEREQLINIEIQELDINLINDTLILNGLHFGSNKIKKAEFVEKLENKGYTCK